MLHHARVLLVVLAGGGAVGLSNLACSSGVASEPERKVEVVSPATGLKVTAAIASVSLGDSLAGASNLQIAFAATEASAAATIEITSVVLIDTTTGGIADTLTASQPQVWNGSAYEEWNQRVTPRGDLRASYALTTPDWSMIDGSGSRSYKTPFTVRVTMKIDGVELILESTRLNREPVSPT